MPFRQPDSIRYYTFDSLDDAGIVHAVFTRRGGVSPRPWESLNVGNLHGDDPGRVLENRLRAFRSLNRKMESLYDVWQVHSAEVVCTSTPRPPDVPHIKADIILTDQPGVTLFMRFADCVPILLYDPVRKVAGIVHAGWKGTVRQAASAAIDRMRKVYSSNPRNVLAAIGPSIGSHHYEVGEEVVEEVRQTFPLDAKTLLQPVIQRNVDEFATMKYTFDLWGANRLLLERAGVKQIEIPGICTACHLVDWYSHRGEGGQTGRFGVLIGLRN
jgi:YfiH family protein